MVKEVSALSEARYISGLTQDELAEKMGVTVQTILKWEKNPGSMKVDSFFNWYSAMNGRGQAALDKYLDEQRLIFST